MMKRMIYRLGLRLGPRGCVLLLAGIGWVAEGIGVLQQMDGRISDAPHIQYMPHTMRAILWIATGLISIFCAFNRNIGHIGAAALLAMPFVRVVSYSIAWALSWPPFDHLFNPAQISGYDNAWYYLSGSCRAFFIAIFAVWAPISWSDADRAHGKMVTNRRIGRGRS